MKRIFLALVLSVVLLLTVVSSAAVWPPPVYDMPRTAVETSDFSGLYQSLKASAGALVNTGFLIFGMCASVRLISTIFNKVFSTRFHFSARQASEQMEASKRLDGVRRSSAPLFQSPRVDSSEEAFSIYRRQSDHSSNGEGRG